MTMKRTHDDSATTLGFWLYLMTDLMLFAALFASFMVLRNGTAGSASARELFDMNLVLTETMVLLASSLFCGLAWLAYRHGKRVDFVMYIVATLVAGAVFLGIELTEFATLVGDGHSWQRSAFLSSYFALVGTHGLHIAVGLVWGIVLGVSVLRRGMNASMLRRFGLFSLFWHFLDIVWIFIFTIVYVIGGAA